MEFGLKWVHMARYELIRVTAAHGGRSGVLCIYVRPAPARAGRADGRRADGQTERKADGRTNGGRTGEWADGTASPRADGRKGRREGGRQVRF